MYESKTHRPIRGTDSEKKHSETELKMLLLVPGVWSSLDTTKTVPAQVERVRRGRCARARL